MLANFPFGVGESYHEIDTLDATGSVHTLSLSNPDRDALIVVTGCSYVNFDGSSGPVRVQVLPAPEGDASLLAMAATLGADVSLDRQGMWILDYGDRLQALAYGLTAGDTIRLSASGYLLRKW